ncbi:MAG: hypothetical protein U1E39_18505 [Planctomycetota bacterium]
MRSPEGALAGGPAVADTARLERFFDAALAAFDRAAAVAGLRVERIGVAGQVAELRFAGPSIRERLFPALEHLVGPGLASPSLTVSVFDAASTGVPMPPPAWPREAVGPRGEIAGFADGPWRVAFNVGSGILLVHDRDGGRAIAWTADAAAVPYYETASPMRPLLAWWLGDAGRQVVHAAAVGRGERGVLLTGRGGSGKTTTALLCVQAGLAYAGDNNLVLGPGTPARGHALYGSATVRPGTLERLPALRARLRNADRLDEEKGLLFVGGADGTPRLPSFDVAAILLPRVVGGPRSRLEPASAGACFAALAPSSVLSLPGAREAAVARLGAWARSAPAHHLLLGDDLDAIPGLVAGVLGAAP